MPRHFTMRCRSCRDAIDDGAAMRCPRCGGTITFDYLQPRAWPGRGARMWDFAALLPLDAAIAPVTLGEGGTPLVAASNPEFANCWWKVEGANPTGSQKDRAISVAVSHARAIGAKRIIVASTGSVGLACAAYAAKAQIPCLILLPRGTPAERLKPMLAFGATVAAVDTTFEAIERLLRSLDTSWFQASTIAAMNPFQAEGPKTIAYEIVTELGFTPDWMIVPVGGGGTLAGIHRGFDDLRRFGRTSRVPRLVVVQSDRFNALEIAMARNLKSESELQAIAGDESVETIARNLKHGVPPDALSALAALRASDGIALSVSDEDVRAWQARLAASEAIFCEPSSAASAVALERLRRDGTIARSESAVALITGSAFREMSSLAPREPLALPGNITARELERLI